MRGRLLLIVGLSAVMLTSPASADWANDRADAAHTSASGVTGPEGSWSSLLTHDGGLLVSNPVVSRDRACVSAADGSLTCFDTRDGSVAWRRENITVNGTTGAPMEFGGILYAPSNGPAGNGILSLNLSDGSLLGYSQATVGIGDHYALAGEVLGFVDPGGSLTAVGLRNGSVLWSRPVNGTLTVAAGSGFFFLGGEMLLAINSISGELAWSVDYGGVVYSPTAVDNVLYFVTNNDSGDKLHAFDLRRRTDSWVVDISASARSYAPTVCEDKITISGQPTVWTFSTSGKLLWASSMLSPNAGSPPTDLTSASIGCAGGILVVPTVYHGTTFLRERDGRYLGQMRTITTSVPAITNSHVYSATLGPGGIVLNSVGISDLTGASVDGPRALVPYPTWGAALALATAWAMVWIVRRRRLP